MRGRCPGMAACADRNLFRVVHRCQLACVMSGQAGGGGPGQRGEGARAWRRVLRGVSHGSCIAVHVACFPSQRML